MPTCIQIGAMWTAQRVITTTTLAFHAQSSDHVPADLPCSYFDIRKWILPIVTVYADVMDIVASESKEQL